MKKIIFKAVKGYEGKYLISNEGQLLSLAYGKSRLLKPKVNRQGYYQTILMTPDGRRKNEKVHRLVLETFVPNPDNKPHVNHKNGNKADNRVENLEWCTPKENAYHAEWVLGVVKRPPKKKFPPQFKYRLKLDEQKVKEIVERLKNGEMGKYIARDYGVSDQTVYDIKNGRCWSNI